MARRVSPKQYAAALIAACAEQSKKETAETIERLIALVAERGQAKQLAAIVEQVERQLAAAAGMVTAEVTTARQLTGGEEKKIIALLKDRTGATDIALQATVDPAVIGGMRIRVGDTIIDASLKQTLGQLVQSIV